MNLLLDLIRWPLFYFWFNRADLFVSLIKTETMKYYPFYFIVALHLNMNAQSFTKITSGPLVNSPGDSRSVNWVDINNDGNQDCMITNGPPGGQNNTVYINNGQGGFTALTGDSIVLDGKPSDGATWADTDNDGDMDAFVVNWYGVNNLYYTNNGNGSFTKINSGSLVNDGGYSETASWGDYDNDGLVDLYVTNSSATYKNFLYHNLGANGFSAVTVGDVVNDALPSRCVNWTDIDQDGDVDLFVTNEIGYNENIYRNDGAAGFTKLTTGPLLNDGRNTMSSSWGDYDNDGDLDVYLTNEFSTNALFRNDGNFNFTKMAGDTVSKDMGSSFSSAWSDVDNDGDLDLFVTNAFGQAVIRPSFFYLNNGNGSFSRVGSNAVINDSVWTYGCAFGDYDNDGFEDLAAATWWVNNNTQYPDLLYHNNGNSNKWITIKLQGVISNRAAIGTKIRVKAVINGNAVWQMREISAQNAYCSQNDIRAHFGLGNATQVDSVKIQWPSGILQYSVNLAPNQFMTIIESLPGAASITEQETQMGSFRLFPNPALGQVTLQSAGGFKHDDMITLSDVNGRVIAKLKADKDDTQLTLDLKPYHLAAGSYVVMCKTKRGVFSQQLIVTK